MPENQRSDFDSRQQLSERPSPDALQVLNVRFFLAIIRERWLIAAVAAILICVAAGYLLLTRDATYESKALLVVDRAADRVVDVPEVVESGLGGDWSQGDQTNVLLQTHVGEMSNVRFIRELINRLTAREISAIIAPYQKDPPSGVRLRINELLGLTHDELPPKEMAVELIEENLHVRRVPETLLIEVHFTHREREIAAAVANALVKLYIQHAMDRRLESHRQATGFLYAQAEELRADLEQLEREAQEYRETHNLVSLDENQNIVGRQMEEVSSALTQVRIQRVSLESTLRKVEELIAAGSDSRELATFQGFGFLQEAGDRLDELRNERELLSERYLENHPQMRENQQSIQVLERTIRANLTMAFNDLKNQHAASAAQEQELTRELAEAETRSLDLDRHAVNYRTLGRKAESARTSYSHILDRLQETSITAELQNTNLRIVQTALPPRRPASPQPMRVAAIIGFLGGVIFFGLPIGLNFMNTRLRHASDVEAFLRRPLLGEIPLIRKFSVREKARLGDQQDEENPGLEAFRAIHSYLSTTALPAGQREGGFVMALLGSLPGEGKTFTAANLAGAFAAHGKRTLLIDCDLRGPGLAPVLNLKNPGGLEAYLQEDSETSDGSAPRFSHISPRLSLLSAKEPVPNATELIEGERFARLIEYCRREFQVIVLDTPPLKVFPDALSIVKHADSVLYVCEFSRVEMGILKQLLHCVERVHRKPVSGVIINKMPTRKSSRYRYSLNGYYGAKDYRKDYYGNRMEQLCLRQRVGEWPVLRWGNNSQNRPEV